MNGERSRPPALAAWLLRHMCRNEVHASLVGDLLERFDEGESDGWFWRQVLTIVLIRASNGLRAHWPQILFSIAGGVILLFWGWRLLIGVLGETLIARIRDWGLGLRSPMSVLYDLVIRSLFAAMTVQPILAVLLVLDRAFRWRSLLRTLLISVPLIAANVAAFEWWASPGMASVVLFLALILCTLLVSAWVGCQSAPGSTISGDSVLLATRAIVTALTAAYLLHASLDRSIYNNGGIGSRGIVLVETFVISALCVWTARRLNRRYRRSMPAVILISWTLVFGYSTFTYWSRIVADSIDHPWFRPYFANFLLGFFSMIAGALLGGLLNMRNTGEGPASLPDRPPWLS